jgi:hypothetical protein
MAKIPSLFTTAKPLQPKLARPVTHNEPGSVDPRLQATVAGFIHPKEVLGKLPTVLQQQAAHLPAAASGAALDQAQIGKGLVGAGHGSKALDQRMKDGVGLGRGDSLGLVQPASKLSKNDVVKKPDGRAPQAGIGAVQQRDQYAMTGDSFLMAGGRQATKNSQETVEGGGDLVGAYTGIVAGLVGGRIGVAVGMADSLRTIPRDLSRSGADGKTAFDAAVTLAGNTASLAGELGPAVALSAQATAANAALPAVAMFAGGYAVGSAADKLTNGALSDAGADAIEAIVETVCDAWHSVTGGYVIEDGGPIDPQTLQKINVLKGLVNPNSPLVPDADPRSSDPLTNPQRGDGATGVARPFAMGQTIFNGVNPGVICPGPDQLKALVSPGQVDFLTGAFQQKTDALINPARNENGSVGGPVLGAPGRVAGGQAGFNAISTDGLSERNMADFVLNHGAAAHGFQSISTDGLSERPVVGFSLGEVPSAATGFQAISTDGLSECSGAGQVFMAATQGTVSSDPFAVTVPTISVF